MKKNIILAICLLALTVSKGAAQTAPFQIALEPVEISGLNGLQAYAWGQHNGKWLIIGGRLDGLHRRQPFAAFDLAGHNDQLLVIDPASKTKWSAPLSSLPAGLQEQLSSTNMEFYQEGDYLYLVGGYGYSNTVQNHTTYPNLSAVKVPEVIQAIIDGAPFAAHFRQITDTLFAVTGGYLNKIYDTFYLTGGQKFIGRYNPMGPNHGPGFVQVYTNAIRRFKITDDGVSIAINRLPEIYDAENLHRRDYNVAPQIMPSGQEGLTAFSGVFRTDANLPFLNCVNIDSAGYAVNNDFAQYYNHYHCAHAPLYSAANNEMHTVFFGGIAQYYDNAGTLVQDDNVPFVKTIARVARNAAGVMTEYKLPVEMPALLGAGSEFIPLENLPQYPSGVLKLDEFSADTTLIGYIYGGISSTGPNIFFSNTGAQSSASSQIFKVLVLKNTSVGLDILNDQSAAGSLQLQIYPNPNDGAFKVTFRLEKSASAKLILSDAQGKTIRQTVLTDLPVGENTYAYEALPSNPQGIYYLTLETEYGKARQKIILRR